MQRFIRVHVLGLPGEIPITPDAAEAIVARGFGRFWLRLAIGSAAIGLTVWVLGDLLWDRLFSKAWPLPGEYVAAVAWAVLFGALFGRMVARGWWRQVENLAAGIVKT